MVLCHGTFVHLSLKQPPCAGQRNFLVAFFLFIFFGLEVSFGCVGGFLESLLGASLTWVCHLVPPWARALGRVFGQKSTSDVVPKRSHVLNKKLYFATGVDENSPSFLSKNFVENYVEHFVEHFVETSKIFLEHFVEHVVEPPLLRFCRIPNKTTLLS